MTTLTEKAWEELEQERWNRLSWAQVRVVLVGSQKDSESLFFWLPSALIERILLQAHHPRWRPTFTSLRALPRRMGSISAKGSRLTFPTDPLYCFDDDARSTASIELDGEGLQLCELSLSYVGIGSTVRLFNVSDGLEQVKIAFSINPPRDKEERDLPFARRKLSEEVHIIFDAQETDDCSEWATFFPSPSTRGRVRAGRYVAHAAAWSEWSHKENGRAENIRLLLIFDFRLRTMRLALNESAFVSRDDAHWSYLDRAIPIGHEKLRLGLAGWWGDEKMRHVLPDGGIQLRRITATVTVPQVVPTPKVALFSKGGALFCAPATCMQCRANKTGIENVLDVFDESWVDESWSCDVRCTGCLKRGSSLHSWSMVRVVSD
jgi:hypothetical protein